MSRNGAVLDMGPPPGFGPPGCRLPIAEVMTTSTPREPVIGRGMTTPMTTALRTQQIEYRPGGSDRVSPFALGVTDKLVHGHHVARSDWGDRMPVDLRRHVHRPVAEG